MIATNLPLVQNQLPFWYCIFFLETSLTMEAYDNEIEKDIMRITQEKMRNFISVWRRTFSPNIYNEQARILREVIGKVYSDIEKESLAKRDQMKKELEDIKTEAQDLIILLNSDLKLPTIDDDDDENVNTPLSIIIDELNEVLEELQEERDKRRQHITELLLQQEELCELLGVTPKPLLDDPLPTASELHEFRVHLNELDSLRVERTKELYNMRNEIKGMLKKLEMKVQTDAEHRLLNDVQINLNKDTFNQLQGWYNSLQITVQELYSSIDSMRQQLENLWERLAVSPSIRVKYRKLEEYNRLTHGLLMQELQRCETFKRQNIKSFVEKLREELREWWDKTMKSEKERNRFIHMKSTCYTDDLLDLHEMELEELKQFYEENKQIFSLYTEWEELWKRSEALEAKANDPARYNNRGGQLLREEKERKVINNKLPKIEDQIKELAHNYESRFNKPFTINGDSVLIIMEGKWELKRLEKEVLMSSRKQKTPMSTGGMNRTATPKSFLRSAYLTPSQRTMLRTPQSSSAQKRTLHEVEKVIPNAKRSLRHVMASPSMIENNKNIAAGDKFKAPAMKKKIKPVIATTINQRRSKGAIQKRRSMRGKNQQKNTRGVPEIGVTPCSDDDYEVFEKHVDVRSSTIVNNIEYTKSTSNHLVPRIRNNRN